MKKIPRLCTDSTLQFKSRWNQFSVSSTSEVFVKVTYEGRDDFLVIGRKRCIKKVDSVEGRSAEAGAVNAMQLDPFEEEMLIQPDHHHHRELERSDGDSEQEKTEGPGRSSELSKAFAGEELLSKSLSKSEARSDTRKKEQPSLTKQSKIAMVSSISPREEKSSSKMKKEFSDIL